MIRPIPNYLSALFFILLSGVGTTPVIAEGSKPLLNKDLFSIGAGVSRNSVRHDDETGFQFFAAYDLNEVNVMDGVSSSVEFGFMDYGFSHDSTGIWGNYVVKGLIGEKFGWLARLGLDIGDDSGLMVGAGVSYATSDQVELRGEYVVRDDVDSVQFNFLFHL
ncbi:MAG: porin family protein [Gammaproteobacteria bacterium]|nr:porin family protein [Gammaproteobacteria bacterium]